VPAMAVVARATRAREMDFMVEDRCVVLLLCENFAWMMMNGWDGMWI
jgi:hypothetical protein